MLLKRKEFLKIGSLASASLFMPQFLKAFERNKTVPPGNRVLVVIQFSGGNDGLNTVIPVSSDIYYQKRPKISITKAEAGMLTTDVGLHPALGALTSLYGDGSLAILNSVGYPNPDRSHFRSMDIWQTASDSKDYLTSGWIGRYLDAQCKACDKPTQALELDDVLSLALKGEQQSGLACKDPRRLYGSSSEKYFRDLSAGHLPAHDETVDYLYKTMSETISSAEYIFKQSRLNPSTATYPNTTFGKDVKTIASLIFSDINTRIYYVSLGSFDTHVNQNAQQTRLFSEFNDAIASFTTDLKKNNRFEDVLIMSFSEFGRRVAQNASNGTDHGTANNMFFIGGGLKQKGLLNEMPDLSDLTDGDIKHKIDFKSVYATVLNKWLKVDDRTILGQQYNYLDFI